MERYSIVGTVLIVALLLYGCSRGPGASATNQPSLTRLPAEMKVKQRTTTRVPGSKRSLHLTIDDITGGQVMSTLVGNDGKPVLPATSLKPGESATFMLGGEAYQLTLTDLDNSLLGEDSAAFAISSGAANATPDETKTIEQLLAAVEASADVVFIRNGVEHSARESAEHLRAKWKASEDRVMDVESFIEKIATKSSISGEPYRVRKPDDTELPAAEYLREKMKELQSKR